MTLDSTKPRRIPGSAKVSELHGTRGGVSCVLGWLGLVLELEAAGGEHEGMSPADHCCAGPAKPKPAAKKKRRDKRSAGSKRAKKAPDSATPAQGEEEGPSTSTGGRENLQLYQEDVPLVEPEDATRRLAVVNLEWSRLTSMDLMVRLLLLCAWRWTVARLSGLWGLLGSCCCCGLSR